MPKFNKEEVTRFLVLPTAIAAVMLYTNHCALTRDQKTRCEIAAHLKMPDRNPSWSEIQDRADGMAYIEALHMRLAISSHHREAENIKRAHHDSPIQSIDQDNGVSQSTAPVIALPIPMAIIQ